MKDECPCGSGESYLSCCGRYLQGGQFPETAEQLMRSRYCAYVLARADYLLATWHASTRPAAIPLDTADRVQWLGLKIIRAQQNTDSGVVEFVARHKVKGKAHRLHEISQFAKAGGRWMYVDGEIKH